MTWPCRLILAVMPALALAVLPGCASARGGQGAALGQAEKPEIDFGREVRYFSGESAGFPVPDYRLLQDPVNSRILNMALTGATQSSLEKAGIADAASRLAALVKGQCLR